MSGDIILLKLTLRFFVLQKWIFMFLMDKFSTVYRFGREDPKLIMKNLLLGQHFSALASKTTATEQES